MLTEILPFSGNSLHEAVLQERQRSYCNDRPKNASVMVQSCSALSLMTLLSRIPSLCSLFLWKKKGAIKMCAFCLKAQPKQQKKEVMMSGVTCAKASAAAF